MPSLPSCAVDVPGEHSLLMVSGGRPGVDVLAQWAADGHVGDDTHHLARRRSYKPGT
jgi:hypothetical protein